MAQSSPSHSIANLRIRPLVIEGLADLCLSSLSSGSDWIIRRGEVATSYVRTTILPRAHPEACRAKASPKDCNGTRAVDQDLHPLRDDVPHRRREPFRIRGMEDESRLHAMRLWQGLVWRADDRQQLVAAVQDAERLLLLSPPIGARSLRCTSHCRDDR